jgi:hypothetical protein
MNKTLILIALCLIFMMCMVPASVFADYEGASSWAVPELDKAAGCGLITDRVMSDVSGNVTREEFAEIVVRMYELSTGKKAEAGNANFTDTTNEEILKAANMGMVLGAGGKFSPDNLVTREQMAAILLRALKVINPEADFSTDGAEKFADDNMISAYARDGVYYCSKNNLLKGVGGNKFNPQGNSSREAAIIVCLRSYELYKQASVPRTPASQQGPQAGPGFTNVDLEQNIEKLDSYRRIIRTITPATATTKKWETIKEFAYIKNPISRYMKLDFPDSGSSYLEEIIIGSKMWNRDSKDGAWTEWNEWYAEKPAALEYDLSTQPYPINYAKLTYTEAGTEKINGINCIKYTVSGIYSDEFSDERSGSKYPITLSASGTIWIADYAAIKTAIIRQRIKVNTDIIYSTEKAIHAVSEDVIEDDVMDINSVKIIPPLNAIIGN